MLKQKRDNNLIEKIKCNFDKDKKELKKIIFDFSFSILEGGLSNSEFKEIMLDNFKKLKKTWFEIKNVFRNKNTANTITNIIVNYHIKKYKETHSKVEKDIHFSMINELMYLFIVEISLKENMKNYNDDLISAWMIGLFKALESDYDPYISDFSTFSYMKIRKEIQNEKSKINPNFNFPTIHDYYYSVYIKIHQWKFWQDSIEYDEEIIKETVNKLNKSNEWITFNLIKDIVSYKTNWHYSLDTELKDSSNSSKSTTYIDLLKSSSNLWTINEKIDYKILKDNIKSFLEKYPDFEKIILERRLGLDLGWDNKYPVYEVKVTREWRTWIKEMIALKWTDAIKRVKLLWYEVLSSKEEVEGTKRYETIVWGSLEKLKEYFEIKKLTKLSITALQKNEIKVIDQLKNYFKGILEKKWINNTNINVSIA